MKKLIPIIVLAVLLIAPFKVSAIAGEVIEWNTTGPGNPPAKGYFLRTGSDIVQIWTDHPSFGPSHWVAKPLSIFEDAAVEGCDSEEVLIKSIPAWYPIAIRNNALTLQYKTVYDNIFIPSETYFLCIYEMDS